MAELADAPDLGSGGIPRAGSSPVIRTTAGRYNLPPAVFFCLNMHFRSVFSIYVKISSGISTEFPHGSSLADPAAHR